MKYGRKIIKIIFTGIFSKTCRIGIPFQEIGEYHAILAAALTVSFGWDRHFV